MRHVGLKVVLLLILAASETAFAQDWARAQLEKSPRHREWVTVKYNGRSVETFVVYPEAKEKRPVVLIIHEIFGLTDWAQELADEVAAAGYIAVAPDLLSGMAPNGGRTSDFAEGKVMEAVGHLNPDQITADLNAVADYALKIPASQWEAARRRVLLGRRTKLPLCQQSRRPGGCLCFLRATARQRCHAPHQGSGVWVLRRQ